jgi:hypothetical protein
VTPERLARAAARTPPSLRGLHALDRLDQRESAAGLRNARLLATGVALVIAVAALLVFGMNALRVRFAPHAREGQTILLSIAAGMALLSFLIALSAKRESRADVINQFIETGSRSTGGGNDNPLVSWSVALAFVGMLYGAFMTVDAIKSMWLRARLRDVDRFRAADILARLIDSPQGIDPRPLLRHGEDARALRRVIAYLMTYDWADISPAGDHLVLLPTWRRSMREQSSVC